MASLTKTLISLLFFAIATLAHAGEAEPIFGSEFTFTNFKHLAVEYTGSNNTKHNKTAYFEKYKTWAEKYCETHKCTVHADYSFNEYIEVTVKFEDGLKISAGRDQNVIEFRMSPMTEKEMVARSKTVQEVVFDGMKDIGLEPSMWYGSGHLNIDISTTFGNDIRFLKNFIVDYHNHPALAEGILESDFYNALPMSMYPENAKNEFEKLLRQVDAGEIQSMPELVERMQKLNLERFESQKKMGLTKGVSLYFPNTSRLEVRAMRAQNSFDEFIMQSRLFSARAKFVKTLTDQGVNIEWKRNVGSNDPIQALSQFYNYVKDTGLEWREVRAAILPAKYKVLPLVKSPKYAYQDIRKCPYYFKRLWQSLQNKIGKGSGL